MARFSNYRFTYALLLWLRPLLDSTTLSTHLTRFAFSLIALFSLCALGSGSWNWFWPSGFESRRNR